MLWTPPRLEGCSLFRCSVTADSTVCGKVMFSVVDCEGEDV